MLHTMSYLVGERSGFHFDDEGMIFRSLYGEERSIFAEMTG